eukprot:7745729-Pyramimonas_sp.AAC.1
MSARVCVRVCRRSAAARSLGHPKRPGSAALAEGHYNSSGSRSQCSTRSSSSGSSSSRRRSSSR